MIKLGEKQELEIVKQVEFGVYLSDPEEALLSGAEAPRVLLPVKQVPEGAKRGDRLTVFVYRDSKDRLIASTRMPLRKWQRSAPFWIGDWKKTFFFLLRNKREKCGKKKPAWPQYIPIKAGAFARP